ncbi:hypothetical protein DCC85_03890 [Paenibacillus sp. CAA11]|uniref:hypothetical protein n=1 Tax=Paenibacillus sp. CAA11 TaxID=1532905 RepID=UPI000D35D4AE|nr:hypothetical protein [Paenibacillus sp. CAA11]AWB43448.1 hypothetical protein DCC85_03890 [Paenibacillus sp. CAA11]
MDQENLKNIIVQTIYEITNVEVTDHHINLLSNTYGISPVDLLYIIDSLEAQVDTPLFGLFEKNDHGVVTVSNLSQHIYQLLHSKQPIL